MNQFIVVAYFGIGSGKVLSPVQLLSVDATTLEINTILINLFIYSVFQSQNPLLSSYISQLMTYQACYGYTGKRKPVNSIQNKTKGFEFCGEAGQGQRYAGLHAQVPLYCKVWARAKT